MYALDLSSGNLIWAKNFGIPFRSNVKIENEKIYLANQDNILYCVDAIKGELIWQFATSLTFLKTDFINNIIIDNDTNSIIFFNTNGELYSINYINQKINWVINTVNIMANSTVDLLLSVPIILKNDSIYVYNGSYFTSYNKFNGLKNWNTKISLKIKPIATKNNIFLITKKDLLVCLDSSTGNLIWSQNIYKSLDVKKKKINKKFGIANSLIIAQNELVIFTSTGQMLSFDFRGGSLISHKKMTSFGLGTDPIFVKGYLYLFDKNYKLFKFQ